MKLKSLRGKLLEVDVLQSALNVLDRQLAVTVKRRNDERQVAIALKSRAQQILDSKVDQYVRALR